MIQNGQLSAVDVLIFGTIFSVASTCGAFNGFNKLKLDCKQSTKTGIRRWLLRTNGTCVLVRTRVAEGSQNSFVSE
jgi:hypothetical protein